MSFDKEMQLDRLIEQVFEYVINKKKIKAKWNAALKKVQLYKQAATDMNWFLDMIGSIQKPDMAKGYQVRIQRHSAVYPQSKDGGPKS